MSGDRPPAVCYLVSQYPKLSHAFIDTEIDTLEALGVPVSTVSIRPPGSQDVEGAGPRARADRTRVLLASPARPLVRALGSLVRRAPGRLPGLVAGALRTGPPTLRARVFQVFYLLEALLLWDHMRRLGVRHVHVHFANNGADVARLTVAIGTAVDGPSTPWRWTMSMHGPTEFEDQVGFDLQAKVDSASAVACISDFCRSQLMRLLNPADWDKLHIVRMAVDGTRFHPRPAGPRGGDVSILYVGRLVPEKGAPVLLEAVARLRTRGVPVRVTLVGDGPLRPGLEERIQELGLTGQVELAGPQPNDALPEVYRRSDIFCLPSFAEGLPVVLMEAMASGLPVVTTTIAGIPELVQDGVNGLLVSPGRVDHLAEALDRLAADPTLRERFGSAARLDVLRAHEPVRNARAMMDLLDDPGQLP